MQTVEKWATRSDAWTPDDDTRLADLVLDHIRIGSTQLKAFEETAGILGRTAAACGYRWNGVVRKHYHDEIESAKQARKSANTASVDTPHGHDSDATHTEYSTNHTLLGSTSESIQDVIAFLQTYDAQYQKLRAYLTQIEREKQSLAQRVEDLQGQLQTQQVSVEEFISRKQLEDDSRTLFEIMERARRLLGDSSRQAES